MSKRHSIGSPCGNTLFNYFAKSPASTKTPINKANEDVPVSPIVPKKMEKSNASAKTPTSSKASLDNAKRPSTADAAHQNRTDIDDGDHEVISQQPKRRRIIVDSDDSDEENSQSASNARTEKEPAVTSKTANKKSLADDTPSATLNKKVKLLNIMPNSFEEKLKSLSSDEIATDLKATDFVDTHALVDEPTVYLHSKLDFMQPDKIKDINGRRPNHPQYDPTTLQVSPKYLDTLTPGMRQWWVLKSTSFDCVLFFKVGKFYELYHMDADIGVKELGFTYMRGEFAHSGFPEQSYDRMATSLVARGYKVCSCVLRLLCEAHERKRAQVARVEQTETPDMMQERLKKQHKTTKFDKVVAREICQITNRGTQVFGQQVPLTNDHQPNYMLAVAEKHTMSSNRFGVCFVDTSLGQFHIGEFNDDKHCSRLLTLLSHHPPVLVLSERDGISARSAQIFKSVLSNVLHEKLLAGSQFWSAEKTLKTMADKYFCNENKKIEWPDTLQAMLDDGDLLSQTPSAEWSLALKAVGACLWYMSKCLVDQQIMSMAQFCLYTPPDNVDKTDMTAVAAQLAATPVNRHMVLDSISLSNLKIADHENSLLSTLDHCCTQFGKRLLQQWVCAPSCERTVILQRQQAVRELAENHDLLQAVRLCLGTVPDLDRLLSQIHTFGDAKRNASHPDGRAIFFEQKTYNKKKIQDFISTLKGFGALTKVPAMLSDCSAKLLLRLTQCEPTGDFPDMLKTLKFFEDGFDHDEALKTGVIAPGSGIDREYDAIQLEIEEINGHLNDYLKVQEKRFGCSISYFGTEKKRFQLEIPESNAKRADSSYVLEGQKKGSKPVKRFHTETTKELLRQMLNAEDRCGSVLKDLSRRMFEKFSDEYKLWKRCVELTATLDVLTALAVYGRSQNDVCYPEIVDSANGPIFELDEGFHPCMKLTEDFIPNGITLGGRKAPLALLTGPNMGGKSTLMRQVGLLIIMTQMGCPIPAVSCRMSIVDRIFTRLGAQDDIMAGHSTFLVELSETSAILKHATVNSLVLLDELGRGTATYDGTAIAAAVVNFLANLRCRTLFSTHYHNLVDNFHGDVRVSLGHMACMVENEDETDPTQETVTFLYKYSDGPCPKSYGFNAAKLAGMPNSIIRRAHELSKKVEAIALKRKLYSKILANAEMSEIKDLMRKISLCTIKK